MYTYEIEHDDWAYSFEDIYGDTPLKIGYLDRSRYVLGTERMDSDEMEYIESSDQYFCLPVYAYVHGGAVLALNPFSCPFDSGRSGIIYAYKSELEKDFGKEWEAIVDKAAEYVIAAFNQYVNGDIYSVSVYKDGELLDSQSSFLGRDCAEEWARETVGTFQHLDSVEQLQA